MFQRRARPVAVAAATAVMSILAATAGARAAAAAGPADPAAERRLTLAVLYFDYAGRDPQLDPLRKGLAQMLISDLGTADVVQVVEREKLEAVLAEQKLQAGGKVDQRTAVRIGKLLGARYLVLGSFFDVLRSFRVDARLVDVQTGAIVGTIGADGKADDFLALEQKVAAGMRDAVARVAAAAPAPAAGAVVRPPERIEKRRPPPKKPQRLKSDTAVKYGQALAALDAGKRGDARTLLGKVLADQPDFELASRDLERLMQ